jgi:receptor expression-enhancing protein 5/6
MSASSPYSAEKIQLKLKETVNRLDGELGKFKYANEFERRTGVPKSYVALGVAGIGFVMIFFNIAGQLLTNTISWIYPGKRERVVNAN